MRHDVPMLPGEKLPSIIVEAHAVLPFARLDHERQGPWIERKIAAERDRFRGRIIRIGDHSGEAIDEPVNLIIEPPGQIAKHAFGIERPGAISPASQDHPLFIRHAVIVGVLVKIQIRNRSHKNSAAVAMDRRRPAQAVCKNSSSIETTISVRILQAFDSSRMLLIAFRKVTHLDDKKPPILVEGQRYRLGNQRLGGGDELELKPLPQLKGVQGILRPPLGISAAPSDPRLARQPRALTLSAAAPTGPAAPARRPASR